MEFIKKDQLQLTNGGYLTHKTNSKPYTHKGFIEAQQRAKYIVLLSEEIKDKDFVGKEPDNLSDSIRKVVDATVSEETHKYEIEVSKPKTTTRDKLTAESMEWLKYEKSKGNAKSINNAMQEFNTIQEFEEFGLYFTEGVTKLNKIYTISEIMDAVKIIEEKL